MEFKLRPWGSCRYFQNNNPQAVNFHFPNCLMIIVLPKTPYNPRLQSKLNIYV